MKNIVVFVLALILLGMTKGSAQTSTNSVITKTSSSPVVISAAAGYRIEVYSVSPLNAGASSGITSSVSWRLSNSAVLLSSPFATNSSGVMIYDYFNIPTVIAGPATLTVTPSTLSKVLSISYSIKPN